MVSNVAEAEPLLDVDLDLSASHLVPYQHCLSAVALSVYWLSGGLEVITVQILRELCCNCPLWYLQNETKTGHRAIVGQ